MRGVAQLKKTRARCEPRPSARCVVPLKESNLDLAESAGCWRAADSHTVNVRSHGCQRVFWPTIAYGSGHALPRRKCFASGVARPPGPRRASARRLEPTCTFGVNRTCGAALERPGDRGCDEGRSGGTKRARSREAILSQGGRVYGAGDSRDDHPQQGARTTIMQPDDLQPGGLQPQRLHAA